MTEKNGIPKPSLHFSLGCLENIDHTLCIGLSLHSQKRSILGITENCILWWCCGSGDWGCIWSHNFVAITPSSTWIWSGWTWKIYRPNRWTWIWSGCTWKNFWSNRSVGKLFVIDRNTWNNINVCKVFVFHRNTWNNIIVCKLFVFDWNTWNHTGVC